ncbi:MAG: tetratricopeptide repeat protein [Bacteroidales bacterium]|nr:tetratricopeptide repeat protein [Bacteroidales bacterium]
MKSILFFILLSLTAAGLQGQTKSDFLMKGRALVERGKPDQAISLLSTALENYRETDVYLGRAEAFAAGGDYSQAINDYNSANSVSPGSGEYGLARIYAFKGDAATAVYHLELCLESEYRRSEKEIMLDPSFSLVENRPEWRQFWRRTIYSSVEKGIAEIEYNLTTGNISDAKTVFTGLSGSYPGNDALAYAGALISFSEKKYAESQLTLAGLLADEPDNEKYLRLLALAQEASGNPAGASSTYTRLLAAGTAEPEVLLLRAECFRKTGETDRALGDVEKFLDLYPDDKKALSRAGRLSAASGDNLKALTYFSENLRLHPNDAECYVDRANSYFVSKSWDFAMKDYSMALDLQPENPDAWLNKGIAQLSMGKKDDACFDFRKAFGQGSKKAAEYLSKYCIR